MAISGAQWQSTAINSMAINYNQLNGNQLQSTQRTRLLLIARKVDDFACEVLDEKVVLFPALLCLSHLWCSKDCCGLFTVSFVQTRAKGFARCIGCLAGGIEQLEDAARRVLA